MIRILHVDDHMIVRQGLKQILADAPHLKITGEASTAKETLELLKKGTHNVPKKNLQRMLDRYVKDVKVEDVVFMFSFTPAIYKGSHNYR